MIKTKPIKKEGVNIGKLVKNEINKFNGDFDKIPIFTDSGSNMLFFTKSR